MFAEGAGFTGGAEDAGAAGAFVVDALALDVSEASFLECEDFWEVVPEAESALASDLVEAVDSLEVPEFAALVPEVSLFLDLEDFLGEEVLEASAEV